MAARWDAIVVGSGFGGAVAAFGAGAVSDMFGWKEVFLCLAGFALIAVIWVFYMSWYAKKQIRISSTGF